MNTEELKKNLTEKIFKKAEDILQERARLFTALLHYEIAVINTELAMRSKDHGYDFEFISDSYADAVTISNEERSSSGVSLKISIPTHAFKHASDKEFEFFKTYVIKNVLTKMQHAR